MQGEGAGARAERMGRGMLRTAKTMSAEREMQAGCELRMGPGR